MCVYAGAILCFSLTSPTSSLDSTSRYFNKFQTTKIQDPRMVPEDVEPASLHIQDHSWQPRRIKGVSLHETHLIYENHPV